MNPTPDQWMSIVRWVLTLVGGMLVGRGLMEAPAVAKLSDAVINAIPVISTFIAGITPLVTLVWGIIKHSNASKVAGAKELPPADKLQVAETLPDGAKLRMVEAMPDVKSIVARPTATDGVAAAVKDTSRPKVVNEPPTDNSNMTSGRTEVLNLGINQSGGQPSYRGSGDRYINQGDK